MENKPEKRHFKTMPMLDLMKEAEIRKIELKKVEDEISELRKELNVKRKLELKLASRLMTVTHWIK